MGGRGELDHYRLLGVSRDASAREIRRAYRRLARQHHPDLNPARTGPNGLLRSHTRTRILNDPAERARYDAARAACCDRATNRHARHPTLATASRSADRAVGDPRALTSRGRAPDPVPAQPTRPERPDDCASRRDSSRRQNHCAPPRARRAAQGPGAGKELTTADRDLLTRVEPDHPFQAKEASYGTDSLGAGR